MGDTTHTTTETRTAEWVRLTDHAGEHSAALLAACRRLADIHGDDSEIESLATLLAAHEYGSPLRATVADPATGVATFGDVLPVTDVQVTRRIRIAADSARRKAIGALLAERERAEVIALDPYAEIDADLPDRLRIEHWDPRHPEFVATFHASDVVNAATYAPSVRAIADRYRATGDGRILPMVSKRVGMLGSVTRHAAECIVTADSEGIQWTARPAHTTAARLEVPVTSCQWSPVVVRVATHIGVIPNGPTYAAAGFALLDQDDTHATLVRAMTRGERFATGRLTPTEHAWLADAGRAAGLDANGYPAALGYGKRCTLKPRDARQGGAYLGPDGMSYGDRTGKDSRPVSTENDLSPRSGKAPAPRKRGKGGQTGPTIPATF